MSEQLGQTDRMMADLDRRLRTLETAQRVGLNRLRTSYGTAAVDPVTFGAWESGAPGNTWADDSGATGTGYPQLTIETGRKALVIFGCRIINLADNAGTFRSSQALVGFGVAGLLPSALSAPTGQRSAENINVNTLDMHVTYATVRRDLVPGPNTFRTYALWTDNAPAAPIRPRMTDTVLTVIPID